MAVDPRFAVPLAANVVPRPHLHTRLTAGLAARCVLVAAPAGWGKTLLASSWLQVSESGGRPAWITLSPADDDLRAFWTTIAKALLPVVSERAAAMLRNAVADEDLEQVPGKIAAALAGDGTPIVLVLDNLHEVARIDVHESLLLLVRRPPPGLRLVALTRHDPPWPLNQLRLTGAVSEIRASDLAFTADETRIMLDALGIELDAGRLGQLISRTDGWVAGLRLASLEMQRAADPADFVDAFSGDDHAVAAYLVDEVIDRLAPELLEFLVRVSILDAVSAELADAVTGGTRGASTLAELAASNLFVQAMGTGGRWYRLHRLIADLLRARITRPRTVRDLHRRAAEWFLHQGIPLEAARYALRGGLWPLAAEILGVHVLALAVRDNPREVDILLSAVPLDVVLSHGELAATLATARIMQGAPGELKDLTTAAVAGANRLSGPRAERLRLLLDLMEFGNGRATGDLARVVAACRRIPQDPSVLAAFGLAGWEVVPLLVHGNGGTAAFWTGDLARATDHLQAAVNTAQSRRRLRPHLNAAAHLALIRCVRGDLNGARKDATVVVDEADAAGWAVSAQVVAAYLTLAWTALDQDEPAEADSWLARVAEVQSVMPEPHMQLTAAALTALRRGDAGDPVGALSGFQSIRADLVEQASPALTDGLAQVEAGLLGAVGDVEGGRALLARLHGGLTAAAARVAAQLSLEAGEPAAARELLDRFPDDGGTTRGHVEGAVLRSLIAWPQDRALAVAHLDRALLLAAPLELRRPFLVQATDLRDILNAAIEAGTAAASFAVDLIRRMSGQPSRPMPAAPAGQLTDREQLVLRYLASTLSNAEIASELYLSVNTVKSHQRMVYRKLGAAGRREAVRRAKELRLL